MEPFDFKGNVMEEDEGFKEEVKGMVDGILGLIGREVE